MRTTLGIMGILLKEINKRLQMKNKPLLNMIDSRILNESCALVYLMIPAYVFTPKNTREFIVAKKSRFRLNSAVFI
jgi:hypothetical protein